MRHIADAAVGWDADPSLPDWRGLPGLDSNISADVCVVGLGGSGLGALTDLVDRGVTAVGLDAGRVAAGAAGRNGGFLGPGGVRSLHDAIDPETRESIAALYRDTQAELNALAESLGPDVVRRTGIVNLAGLPGAPETPEEEHDREAELVELRAESAALQSIGLTVEDYDGELGRGIFLPDDALINPVRRAFAMAIPLAKQAQLFENSRVLSVRPGAVETAGGTVSAPVVIAAVDGRLDVLLPQLRPLARTVRLQMLATAPIRSGRLPFGLGCRRGYEWAQQDVAGRLLIGGGRDRFADDEETTEADPTEPVQAWIERAAARVAGEPVTVTHRWAASAGYTRDGVPLCLQVDDGVYACGGYSGMGNLVGPLAAKAAVANALDGTAVPAYFRSVW